MITPFISALLLSAVAVNEVQDSMRVVSLDEVNIISNIKETGGMRQQPASSSHISVDNMSAKGDNGLKALGTMAPNFFVPDYGSKQTSAIYMRGIGSRIGTPTVGLYVDNVPYYDKTAFDFSFFDVESVDILRGPQSTLYGRNTMSGLIKVHSFNPFYYNGTNIRLGYATAEQRRQVSAAHYQRVNDKFAFSAGGFYEGTNGFFKNDFTGKKMDNMESGGGRLRAIWKATNRLTFDANVGYEYSDEGSYPYYYTGTLKGEEQYQDCIGKITSNLDSRYRRGMLNASLNTEYKTDAITLNSVTAYQNINDRMFMDQDFLKDDIYSLEQKQKIGTFSEEILLKNNGVKKWNWIVGANVFYQKQDIIAPVIFRKDGVAWLNSTINTNANKYLPSIAAGPMTMNFKFADNIEGDNLAFNSDFNTPVFGAALFHQSTINNLFGIEGLSASLGLRLDYEDMSMKYNAAYTFNHTYSLMGVLTPMNREITMVPEASHREEGDYHGKMSNDYLQLLPKASVIYSFNHGNVYATVSRGYRSGGYNPQDVSEMLRSKMQTAMMKTVRDVTVPVLEAQPMVPADKKEAIKQILNRMATESPIDYSTLCTYKPEYAWNYEIGSHLDFMDKALSIDLSAFLINVTDLQLSKMSETGLGRTITNAGRSRSMGMELALRAHPVKALSLGLAYGLANATFRKYEVYDENTNTNHSSSSYAETAEVDCRGNRVPFVPSNTLNLDAAYTFSINNSALRAITLGVDYSYVGKIYWDELNKYSQSAYGLLGARMQFDFKHFDVQLWGRNLTDKKFNTFWFESMSRGFEQHGKPLQFGGTISFTL